jgi:predicted enzyme related to lactoylglutathione lyase
MQGPVPDQFNLVVTDMDAAVAFYRKLGMAIPDADPQWQGHHRTVTLPGGIDLDLDSSEFARHWNCGWRGGMGVLGFARYAVIEDPDGNAVGIMSPANPDRRSQPDFGQT